MIGQIEGTTERQRGCADWHGRVALRIIDCLAATDCTVDAIQRILRVIVDETGIRCAGIRLQQGEDFPFYTFNGFSREFIRMQNSLCLRNPDGTPAVDAQGRPALACMCGRILRGQSMPGEDFFTAGGSFFTPCLQTLATTVDPAKLGPICGRCIAEGFQTHALLPLRRGGETIGLLHLSDPNPQVLTGDDVAFLERLGASAGIALAHRQALEDQRRTDDTYRELFEKLGWGYALYEIVFDAQNAPVDYVTLDTNQSYEKILGAPKEDVVGKRASAILPAAELASWLALFGRVATGGPPTTYEVYSPHNQKHFRGHVYSLKRGFFAVAFEDVTERVRADEALHAAEARIRLTTEALGVGTYRWDFVNGTHEFSPEFLALYGLRPDEALQVGPDLVPLPVLAEDRPAFLEAVATANNPKGSGEVKGEFRVRLPDGSIRWLMSWARTTFGGPPEQRRPVLSLGALVDITERKQAEAERRSLQNQLFQAQKMESLGALAGGIAHDFNNILAVILGGVELALMKTDSLTRAEGESLRIDLDDVQHAAQRASALVKQILSFSRRNPEEKRPLFLRPLVKEACKFLRSVLPTTIEIHRNLSIDGPVLANPTQIHQVVMNLLTNAGLAMPEGGRIDVGLDQVDLDQTFAAAHPGLAPGQFARLTVRDTGCGIPPENLGRIFEPLFTTRSDRHSTGLGLAIVHGIAAEHGGTVTVASEVGRGATFEVFLPLHAQDIPAAVLREKCLFGTERILFVDDEEALVQMAERGLAVLGYQVKGFVSSVEALRAFRAEPNVFDIVVSDLTMPGLTGDLLAREIRRLRPDLPVVILTGATERMMQKPESTAEINAILLKPITVAGLTVCLRRIFDSKRSP